MISSYIVGPEFNLTCRRVRSVIQAQQWFFFLSFFVFESSRQFCVAASFLVSRRDSLSFSKDT